MLEQKGKSSHYGDSIRVTDKGYPISVFWLISQLQRPHENEPEFVARARYAIFLEDRQYGRLNDEQAARILEDIKHNLPQDEKVMTLIDA